MTKEFDDAYRETADYFGHEASPILRDHNHRLEPNLPVLDIGAGQGRHALLLARAGFTVDAVEPSAVAVETVAAIAAREQLPIRTHHGGFAQFAPPATPYGGVLLLGILQLLSWEEIRLLLERIESWTAAGSLIFVTAFSTADPAYGRRMAGSRRVGRNSGRDQAGQVWTYLEPDEILQLLPGYAVVHHWEGLGDEHRHGEGPLERHASIDAVLRRS